MSTTDPIVIVSALRTPMGGFSGCLSNVTAPELGATAIKATVAQAKLGNDNAARNLFERAVSVDRKHAQAWQSWGVMEMRAGNYKAAKTLFKCGIKNDSRDGALWQA